MPLLVLVVVVLSAAASPAPGRAADGIVRAVLFFSPTCPHCHKVLSEDLPPIQDRFGDQLQVLLVDVSTEAGAALYTATVEAFDVPGDRTGVPTLVIGEVVLVGSLEIPEQLPALVEDGLAGGGIDWPAIPGLPEALGIASRSPAPDPATASPAPAASPAPGAVSSPPAVEPGLPSPGFTDRFGRDLAGNSLAVIVLAVLLLVLVRSLRAVPTMGRGAVPGRPSAWVAAAALVGLATATYLAGVELTSSTAVCGPVGDCNAVHASEYARLLGIPIGVLGVAAYLAILGLWLVARQVPSAAPSAGLGLYLLALGGTAFSIYLTFLEPFVIGATCGWCLISAVTMAVLLVLVRPRQAGSRA